MDIKQPRGFAEDIIWGKVKPVQLRMVPKQQTHHNVFNNNIRPNYYNRHGLIIRGDLYPHKPMREGQLRASGEGIFDVITKNIPWGKLIDIGTKVIPGAIDTGFKIADKFKKDPRMANLKSNDDLVDYFKKLLAETTDTKERMEIIREIGKIKHTPQLKH
jgi:hypothetical protein